MDGIGPPLLTPFDESGAVDYERLRELVAWVEDRGVDFLVPCGSTSEAPLLTAEERLQSIETVCDEATVPVLAGTGHPGFHQTLETTRGADKRGIDGALIVTPYYYPHDQETLEAYYRDLADECSVPIYLYSVPQFTGIRLEPETVGSLASHPNIVGFKDSSGSMRALIQTEDLTPNGFDILVGDSALLAPALTAGASGGILAIANLFPGRAARIYDLIPADYERARELNADFVDVDTLVTAKYGIPGLKFAMRENGIPAGYPRRPFRTLEGDAKAEIQAALGDRR